MKFSSVTGQSTHKTQSLLPKLLLLLLISLFFEGAVSLHLQSQPVDQSNVYNKNLYLAELSNVQSRLSNGLQAIKDKFTLMNQELAKTNASESTQIIKLQ
jgi:hypothetical protein